MFQDDPYLMPRNSANARLLSLSKESGRNAAKYIIKQFPQYFDKILAEPNVACLMPVTLTPQLEGVNEEALRERINLRMVKASVDLFDQLLQAGTPVSLETTNSLLDLLCFYGDGEPAQEEQREEKEDLEESGVNASEQKTPKRPLQRGPRLSGSRWRENNDAERIFKIMPERNAHSYCTMIRGMAKHGASAKAYDMYTELLNERHKVDLGPSSIISEVLEDVEKRSFTAQDPDDANFFPTAMQVCCDLKDIKLAYRLNKAMEKGDNWKFLNMSQLNSYWSKFFSLLCMMEQIDVVLKWYREMPPSLFYPSPKNIVDLLQALDAANHLEAIPSVWEDMKLLGFNRRQDLLEEILSLMSRDTHPEETQLAFAKCAEDIKNVHEESWREQAPLAWTGSALGHVAVLFSRVGRTQDAWKVMERFQQANRIPTDRVMDEFLNCAKQTNSPDEAIKLVKLAVSLGLSSAHRLKSRAEKEFELSESQRKALESIQPDSDSSDSDSDSN
ncbi:Pentatricopeptide repeat domain-containing protein 3, mitochondrial [Aix galericulata]|nr:Pentatricopeptide repeat domain-containing protein 3, mitochondrial [Aix galericulata]